MKTRTALVSTLAAGLGLLACNKAADTLGPSESPTGTATLAARLSAASTEAAAVLRQTKKVRATLDTGSADAWTAFDTTEVEYRDRKVSFPSLRVGISYRLTLQGVVDDRTLWSITHTGTLGASGSSENSPKLELGTASLNLKAPSYEVNGATATLTSNSSGGLAAKLYWTRDTTEAWTQGEEVALTKPDAIWIKDSIEGVAGSAWTLLKYDANGNLQQDTLEAPTATLTGADNGNNSPYAGWAALSLTSKAGNTGTLQYSLDGTNWKGWVVETKLYGTGTVRFREARTGYASLVDSQGYAVNPVPLPAPGAAVSRETANSATITLTSKTTAPYKAATLWYSIDSGKSWKSYGDTAFQVDKSLSVLSKDSLEHQKSTICTTVVTLSAVVTPTLNKPDVKIGGTDPLVYAYGASTTPALTKGSGPLSQLPAVTATCQSGSDAKVQYRLAGTASWADLSSGDLTGIDTSRTLEFRCYASPTAFSDSVSLPLILIQPPWIQASDSIFYGTLSTSISLDSVHNGTTVSRGTPDNSQIEYCLTAPSADSCQDNWFVYDNKVLSIDTSKALWARTKYTTNGTVYSYPVKRVFTKASLANTGKLSFPTAAIDSATVKKLYGASTFASKGTTTELSVTNTGALKLMAKWSQIASTNWAGVAIPLISDWSTVDFSNVEKISFKVKASDIQYDIRLAPISEAYSSEAISYDAVLQTSTTIKETSATEIVTTLPSSLTYTTWGMEYYTNGSMTAPLWSDVKTLIQYFKFTITPPNSLPSESVSIEISDIQLILANGKSLPLAISK